MSPSTAHHPVNDGNKRIRKPSQKVVDPSNLGDLEMRSHREARAVSHSHADSQSHLTPHSAPSIPPISTTPAAPHGIPALSTLPTSPSNTANKDDTPATNPITAPTLSSKCRRSVSVESETRSTTPEVDSSPPKISLKDRSKDLDHFFDSPVRGAKGKAFRKCRVCWKKNSIEKMITSEATTCRRHLEAFHEGTYNKWAEKSNFTSKLPLAVKRRKEAAQAQDRAQQTSIESHTVIFNPEKMVPYSDKLFREAAIQWLIETNQPIQALDHPRFKEMIDVAARSTHGVLIPSRKKTREYIMELFKKNLASLCDRLKTAKTGSVSMTCDAWQASNVNAYFAVTGHWIEEISPNVWIRKSALFGFTEMNTAHDGVRLGRALCKVVCQLGVETKVGWITCDNASNNLTMLANFADCLNKMPERAHMKSWEWRAYHIRCLAHVINLATQAFISTYSKAAYYEPTTPMSTPEADTSITECDIIGLVREIAVKVRSSAKRKGRFKSLQIGRIDIPKTLILDMKVRWSSTLAMLIRAIELMIFIKDFIYELSHDEPDLSKRPKIDRLLPTEAEWLLIETLIKLLKFAEKYQQAFSYENTPCLHAAIPALERLHHAWSSRVPKKSYAPFAAALTAGADKINEYYVKTASSHAYTFSLLLDPGSKMDYFKQNWPKDLQSDVLESAKSIFKDHYKEIHGSSGTTSAPSRKKPRHSDNSDDSDDDDTPPNTCKTHRSMSEKEPWLREFERYIDGEDEIEEGLDIVQWWGINARRLPTWASLAFDYLAIMGSSVSCLKYAHISVKCYF